MAWNTQETILRFSKELRADLGLEPLPSLKRPRAAEAPSQPMEPVGSSWRDRQSSLVHPALANQAAWFAGPLAVRSRPTKIPERDFAVMLGEFSSMPRSVATLH